MLTLFFFPPEIFSALYLLLYGLLVTAFAARSLKEHSWFVKFPRGLFNLQKRFAYITEGQKWQPIVWRIPGTGEPGGLPPVGSHRVRHK